MKIDFKKYYDNAGVPLNGRALKAVKKIEMALDVANIVCLVAKACAKTPYLADTIMRVESAKYQAKWTSRLRDANKSSCGIVAPVVEVVK